MMPTVRGDTKFICLLFTVYDYCTIKQCRGGSVFIEVFSPNFVDEGEQFVFHTARYHSPLHRYNF